MNNFIVSIKIPGEAGTKDISLTTDSVSEIFVMIKKMYFNATIVSFIQK